MGLAIVTINCQPHVFFFLLSVFRARPDSSLCRVCRGAIEQALNGQKSMINIFGDYDLIICRTIRDLIPFLFYRSENIQNMGFCTFFSFRINLENVEQFLTSIKRCNRESFLVSPGPHEMVTSFDERKRKANLHVPFIYGQIFRSKKRRPYFGNC